MKIVQPISVTDSVLTSSNVSENDYTAYSTTAGYVIGNDVRFVSTNIHKTYKALIGAQVVVTLTIASPCVVTFPVGTSISANQPVVLTTTGTLPTGIAAGTTVYVKDITGSTTTISATVGGAAINTSGTQSGVHTLNTNYNIPVTNTDYWLETGSTNKWKMFDGSVQSQTSNPSNIILTLNTTATYFDTMAFLNVNATSVRVIVNTTDGTVYDKTATLSSTSGIVDWYSYFFTPITRQTDVIFDGIPKYGSATITIVISAPSGAAACGACIIGASRDISADKLGVEHGAKLGIQTYDVKQRDDFGNYTILERAFNRRADWTVYIEPTEVDGIINLLSSIRAKPILYIGGKNYNSNIVYGFYKDFDIEIAYPTYSICTIQLEGLT